MSSTDPIVTIGSMITDLVHGSVDVITASTRFDDLPSWGSLPALQLLAALERDFGFTAPIREFLAIETVGELAEQLELVGADATSS